MFRSAEWYMQTNTVPVLSKLYLDKSAKGIH